MTPNKIYKIGEKNETLLGGDRQIVLFAIFSSVGLIFVIQTLISLIIGIFLWFSLIFLARNVTKNDKLLRVIFLNYVTYKPFYQARAPHDTPSVDKEGNKKWY